MRQAACKRPCMAFRMKSRASKKKTEVGCVRALLPFFPCPSPLLTLLAEPGLQSSSTNSCCFMLTQRGRLMHSSKKPVRTCQATVINTHTRTRIHTHTHTHTLAHKHTYTPSFFPSKKVRNWKKKCGAWSSSCSSQACRQRRQRCGASRCGRRTNISSGSTRRYRTRRLGSSRRLTTGTRSWRS